MVKQVALKTDSGASSLILVRASMNSVRRPIRDTPAKHLLLQAFPFLAGGLADSA